MKKRNLLTFAVFLTLSIILLLPFIFPTFAGTTALFNVSLIISNAAPTIVVVESVSNTPSEGTTKIVQFLFNASDVNGVGDIPASNALVRINQSGTTLTSSSCEVIASTATVNSFSCNITINYYNLPGAWTINASVYDGASALATDLTKLYTNGNVYGITLKTNSLTFSGSPGQNDINASNNPQTVNNTGNNVIPTLNLTAYDLRNGAVFIGSANFTVNVTNNAVGQVLSNNTPITIAESNVSVQGSNDLYVFLDIPTGVTNGTYASTQAWVLTIN